MINQISPDPFVILSLVWPIDMLQNYTNQFMMGVMRLNKCMDQTGQTGSGETHMPLHTTIPCPVWNY